MSNDGEVDLKGDKGLGGGVGVQIRSGRSSETSSDSGPISESKVGSTIVP